MSEAQPESFLPPPETSGPSAIGIEIDCYEGLDARGPGPLTIDVESLTRHIFVTGATGSGKSTLLREITRQLIGLRSGDEARKTGLLVLDLKCDDTADCVRKAASAVGRLKDVRVLSLDSPVAYDFFAECRTLSDVSEFTRRLTFGCGRVEASGDFWDQYRDALLSAALTWLVVNHSENRGFPNWVGHASSWLLADSLPGELREDFNRLRDKCAGMKAGSPEQIATQQALRLIGEWGDGPMDFRTRANAKATLYPLFMPLIEPAAARLFRSSPFRKFRVHRAVTEGQILVLSINAFLYPALGQMLARLVKADFYGAIFARKPGERLAMLIADEFQLATTSSSSPSRFEDTLALAMMRSRNAGIVAASQGLAGIDRAIGNLNRRCLMGNFGTLFFLRSTESEVESFAQQVCGSVEVEVSETEIVSDPRNEGAIADRYRRTVTRRVTRPVCVPGALARLQTGQAFLLQEGTPPSPHPIWIAQGPH